MNIYVVSTEVFDYDQCDSIVLTAKTADQAKKFAKNTLYQASIAEMKVEYVGIGKGIYAKEGEEILGSFNAG